VPQTGCSKVEAGLTIRESANHSRPTSDLPHDALQWVVCSDLLPVDIGEGVVAQGLVYRLLDEISSLAHLQKPELGNDGPRLLIG